MVKENRLDNLHLTFDNRLNGIKFKGPLGSVVKLFGGKDLVLFDKKIFFFSKSSLRTFDNMLTTVSKGLVSGFFVKLNLVGLGFRFLKIENYILLKLGYGHYTKIMIPKGLHIFGYKRQLFLFGVDFNQVRVFSESLRLQRFPDAYKGKGI